MIDKITNMIVEVKYLGALVDTFSKAAHYAVVMGFVFLLGTYIPPLLFINEFIVQNYELIMLLFYTYIGYSLLEEVTQKQRYGVLVISLLTFKIVLESFTSMNLIFFVLWIKAIIEIFKWITKIKIKLFDKIPPVVSMQVHEYIYYLILLGITASLSYGLSLVVGDSIVLLQYFLAQTMNFLPLYLLFMFMMQLLWSRGLHGDQTIGRIIDVLLIILVWSNIENVVFNIDDAYIINASFHLVFGLSTGSGMTGMLLLALKLFKRQDVKEISEGSLFSINEPVIWGLPIAQNPKYKVPFILAPLLSISFAWYMTSIGFARALTYPIFWGTPPLLRSFLASGGHLQTVLVELMCYAIVFIVYTIFILINKKKGDV